MHRPLDHGLVQMVAASLAGDRFEVRACRRKHPLPRPLAPRVGVLPPKRMRHLHPSGSGSEVALVLQPHLLEVTLQRWLGGRRKDGDPIAIALPTPHGDLVRSEIEVLDPESSSFEETEARTVKQNADQPDRTTQREQHGAHLLPRQDDRQPLRPRHPDEVVEP